MRDWSRDTIFKFLHLFFLPVLLLVGCGKKEKLENYGLPKIELEISDDHFARLMNSGLAKTPVEARTTIENTPYITNVSFAGNSALLRLKRSYQIDFLNTTFRDHRYLRVSSHITDYSMIQGVLGSHILESQGSQHSDIEPVTLYLNRVYQGLYIQIEPVDLEFFSRRNISIARLYKARVGTANFDKEMQVNPKNGLKSKYGGFNTLEISYLAQLAQMPTSESHKAKLLEVLDMDNFLNFAVANIIMKNWDGLANNYYIYKTKGNPKFYFVHWDWDRILQSHPGSDADYEALLLRKNQLIAKVLEYSEFQQQYRTKLYTAITGTLSATNLNTFIDLSRDKIRSAYLKDRFLSSKYNLDTEINDIKTRVTTWLQYLENKYQN